MVSHATPIRFFLVGAFCQQIIIVFQSCVQIEILFFQCLQFFFKVLLKRSVHDLITNLFADLAAGKLVKKFHTRGGDDFRGSKTWPPWHFWGTSLSYPPGQETICCWPVAIICIHLVGVLNPNLGYQWPPGSFQFFVGGARNSPSLAEPLNDISPRALNNIHHFQTFGSLDVKKETQEKFHH